MRTFWLYLRVAVMNELQYRANFFIQILQSAVSMATGLIVLSLVFQRTAELDGWTRSELLVVMGVFTIVGGLVSFAIEPNMGWLMGDVRNGTLDYVLTKPIDSQLLVSMREFRVWKLTDVVVGLGVVVWGVSGLDNSLGVLDVVTFILLLLLGVISLYCLWMLLTTGAFWFIRMEQIQEMFDGLFRSGQYPVSMYPGWLRMTLTFVVPLAFAITVPSQALTDRLDSSQIVIAVAFVAALFLVTRMVWKIGLKRYSGASA